jgi:hypothetical protein
MNTPYRIFKALCKSIVFLLLGFAGTVGAQTIDKEEIAKMAKQNSAQCPYELDGLVVNKIFFDSNYLHYDFTMQDIYMLGRSIPELKDYFADLLRYRFEPKKEHDLYEKLTEIKGGLIYNMTLDSSRYNFTLQYTPDEYQQIWADRKKPEYQDSLKWLARHYIFMELYLENQHTSSPDTPGESFISIDTFKITGRTVTYHVTSDDQTFLPISEHRDEQKSRWDNHLFFDGTYDPILFLLHLAGYDFRVIYENISRTDSFHIYYSDKQIEVMISQAKRFTIANEEQLEAYAKNFANIKSLVADSANHADFYKIQEAEYQDRILYLICSVSEGEMNFNMTKDNTQLFKQYICSMIKNDLESDFEYPDIVFDSVLVYMEDFLQYLHGIKLLFIEENTKKALLFDISADDILKANIPAMTDDQNPEEKILEQILAEQFVKQLEKSNREECPIVSGNMVIDSLSYDFENLHYYCHIASGKALTDDTLLVKKAIRKQLQFSIKEGSYLMDNIIKLKSGFTIHCLSPKSGTTLLIHFSHPELMDILAVDSLSERERARAALNDIIMNINASTPILLDPITRVDSLHIEGDNLVYHYTMLDRFDDLKAEKSSMDWNIRSHLSSSEDSDLQYLILLCVRSGYGLCYRYKPITIAKKKNRKSRKGDVIDICLSAEELQGYIRN